MVNSLVYMANHLQESEERQELMLKSLQLFVQQGIEAKKASDRADATHKVFSLPPPLSLSLSLINLVMVFSNWGATERWFCAWPYIIYMMYIYMMGRCVSVTLVIEL